jgi:hypothetical protein
MRAFDQTSDFLCVTAGDSVRLAEATAGDGGSPDRLTGISAAGSPPERAPA